MLNIIIFSKDRACQLELLLRSIKIFLKDWEQFVPKILYTYSDQHYFDGYEKLKRLHPEFVYVCEKDSDTSFKAQVLQLIDKTQEYTTFFVDDNVFRLPFSIDDQEFQAFARSEETLCLSLRLCPRINYTYSTNQLVEPPIFKENLVWEWQKAPSGSDWGYPMSLDGHIFRTHILYPLIETAEFSNPNFLEEALALSEVSLPNMCCCADSRVVNIPANRVQDSFKNHHGDLVTPELLNQEFLSGRTIALRNILVVQNTSVHQEIPIELREFNNQNLPIRLSVIAIFHNQTHHLVRFVEDLLAQSSQDFEVVIVDHASTDSFSSVIGCFLNLYPNFRLQFVQQPHFNIEEAQTRAKQIARGDFNLNLDPSQPLSSNFLEEYIAVTSQTENSLQGLPLSLLQKINKAQVLLEESQIQLQVQSSQYHNGLKRALSIKQPLQSDLEQEQGKSARKLRRLESKLRAVIHSIYTQLQDAQAEIERTTIDLAQTQAHLANANAEIQAMQSSKFWKLRSKWLKIKRRLGLAAEEISVTCPPAKTDVITQQAWPLEKPLVSVIVPCFNYGQYLEEAVNSVLAQTFQNFEIIVVDDGSTDLDTKVVLDGLKKPKTKILRQSNQKLPNARNNGIRAAQGKYICCLDADDLLKPTYLEKCVAKLESENLDICYSWIQEFEDSNEVHAIGHFNLATLVQNNCVAVSAVFKRSMWESVGGYDESMIHGYEDWNFWIAIAKAGAIGGKVDEPLFLYRKHGRSMIEDAIARHEELYKQIRSNHSELFADLSAVSRINSQLRSYVVVKPYVNLLQSYTKSYQSYSGKPKVLLALPWLVMGGAETVTLELLKTLKSRGFDVAICTTERPIQEAGDNTAHFEPLTNEIYHFPRFIADFKWKEFVFYLFESRKIDLLFLAGSSFFYELLPEIKAYFPNVKIVDQLYNEFGHIENNRQYSQCIDLNIVENKAVESCLIRQYGEVESKICLITNGVNTDYFNPEFILPFDSILAKLSGKFVVTFLGRLSEEKAPDLFVEIVNRLKNNSELEFLMAGNGPMYQQIVERIEHYRLIDRLHLPGFVDARECLSVSSLIVLPSRIDGRPNAVLESLSMGVPVIASSVGGLPELIQHGFNGFLCRPNHVEDFVSFINQVLEDPNLYLQLRKNAREYSLSKLDSKASQQRYINVFNQLLSEGTAS